MKLKSIFKKTDQKLAQQIFIDQPQLETSLLLAKVVNKSSESILTDPSYTLGDKEIDNLDKLVKRRLKGEPIGYILGEKEFYGLNFKIDKNVLIPRPETELLVDLALAKIGKSIKKNIKIIDVGTGSGCIAVAIANNSQASRTTIIASDLSKKALKVARNNATSHKAKINFKQADLLANITGKFDIIIANLPYLENKEAKSVAKLLFHPLLSLAGGQEGLELIYKLISQSKHRLNKNGSIMLEIAPQQKQAIYDQAKKIFNNPKLTTIKDLARLDRVIIIEPK